MPPEQRGTSRSSRYHLADPYLRLYFRFIAPNLGLVEQELTGLLWERLRKQCRALVGGTAFEELCQSWTLAQARAGTLPFAPEVVGSHWAQDVQVDVAALHWRERAIGPGLAGGGLKAWRRWGRASGRLTPSPGGGEVTTS